MACSPVKYALPKGTGTAGKQTPRIVQDDGAARRRKQGVERGRLVARVIVEKDDPVGTLETFIQSDRRRPTRANRLGAHHEIVAAHAPPFLEEGRKEPRHGRPAHVIAFGHSLVSV